jgi:hypothetical protein
MKQVAAVALGSALAAALLLLAFNLPSAANLTDNNPLRPVDTSSPRATLQGFVTALDDAYRSMQAVLQEYGASGRLYLSPDERQKQIAVLQSDAVKAIKALDLSGIPPILRDAVAPERALQLKEILDRIEVPATDAIPDADAMARSFGKAMATARNRARHRAYRNRVARRRISRNCGDCRSPPRILRPGKEAAL